MQNFLVHFYADKKDSAKDTHVVMVRAKSADGVFERARQHFGLGIGTNCTRIEYNQAKLKGVELI